MGKVDTTFSDKNSEASKKGVTDGYARWQQSGATAYDEKPTKLKQDGTVNLDSVLGRSRFDK